MYIIIKLNMKFISTIRDYPYFIKEKGNLMNETSPSELKRLSFIKYLFNIAIEQSNRPDPLASSSVLTFHDSIELFLILACEHINIDTKEHTLFMQYVDKLIPHGLTQKMLLKRLNKSRVDLKHHGLLPHKQDIDGFRESIKNFFIDNTTMFFNIDFDNITMIDLVTFKETKNRLEKAEKHKKNGEIIDGITEIAISFHQLITEFQKTKSSGPGYPPFFFGYDISFERSSNMGLGNDDNPFNDFIFSSFVDHVSESINLMRKALEILSLGLDYKKYTRFILLTPQIFYVNGQYGHRIIRQHELSVEDYEFCFNFVIDCAIHLQEFDSEIKG